MARTVLAGIAALTAFVALATTPILLGAQSSSAADDAVRFHVPQINHFLTHPFDLFHYPATSATTPGHHFALASLLRPFTHSSVSVDAWALRLLNIAIGCVPVCLAWLICLKLSGRPWHATAMVAPLLASNYVVTAATFVTTDNGALAFYALAVFLMIFHRSAIASLAIAFAGMVAWRQLYLPVGGAIAAAMSIDRWDRSILRQALRPKRAMAVTAALIPGLVLLCLWIAAWRGMVPPEFQKFHAMTLRASVPVQAICVFGLYSLVYAPTDPELRRLGIGMHLRVAGPALAVAAILWTLDGSTYDQASGRWGSVVWLLARHGPSVGDKSLVVLALLSVGSHAVAMQVLDAVRRRMLPPELLAFLAYTTGYAVQAFAWQRYVEPQALLTLAVLSSRRAATSRWTALPALAIAAAMGAACLARVSGGVSRWL
jgi:hypothetical protein